MATCFVGFKAEGGLGLLNSELVRLRAVFPEELSEGGKLNIIYPRLLYCLIQVRVRLPIFNAASQASSH